MALAHELKHSYNYVTDPKEFDKNIGHKSDPNFKNDEEKNATTTTEKDVAKSKGEGIRKKYSGKLIQQYNTSGSTSTTPLKKTVPVKNKLKL